MIRRMLKSKIHRATLTDANVDYEGSITIDADLMAAADILEHEAVMVWDVTNGSRFETYAITGEAGSGTMCVNGAAAHLVEIGDLVIVATFTDMSDEAARAWKPIVVMVDAENRRIG
jgi:aspartate 1-decarboxylase